MSRLTQDGTTETVSRDVILRCERVQGNIHFSCAADDEQDWRPYPVDPFSCYMCDHTYTYTQHATLRKSLPDPLTSEKGRLNPSRETQFSGASGDRGIFIFLVQLTTRGIGNLTRLIYTLLYVRHDHAYIYTQ